MNIANGRVNGRANGRANGIAMLIVEGNALTQILNLSLGYKTKLKIA